MLNWFKDCGTFVYENGHCFLGKTTLSNGNVITESDYATAITLYATNKALIQYLTPGQDAHLVTTYCCVTALKVQENFGTVQLNVNSGISTYFVLKKYALVKMSVRLWNFKDGGS